MFFQPIYATIDENDSQLRKDDFAMLQTQRKDLADIITQRRSINSFSDKPVSEEVIIDLLETAKWAPDHGVREPWRFILCLDNGKEHLLEAMLAYNSQCKKPKNPDKIRTKIMGPSAHLLVINNAETNRKKWEENYGAASALIQNFQLCAWEQGIGMIWKTGSYIDNDTFKEAMHIDSDETIIGLMQIGYPDQIPEAKPRTTVLNKITTLK